MQPDRFTIKSQEAVAAAQRLAAEHRNPEVAPPHLLLALLEQEDGLVVPVLQKLGADVAAILECRQPVHRRRLRRRRRRGADEATRDKIEVVLRETFKPEFLNRIDDTVIFHRLSRDDLGRIVELQLAQLAGRLREKGIEVTLTDDARTLLGNLGYDPTYGARPLKRVIQRELIDKLAMKILEGEFREGDRVEVDATEGELTFRAADRVEAGR